MGVLLDFAKAYDTLDRPFLLRALRRLGFPPKFLEAVNQMHLLTTAQYRMEDSVSDTQAILNGIRQGCSLAPTLFVLAVNTLYEAIAAEKSIVGIQLPGGDEVKVTGYADDTTALLANAEAIHRLRLLLDQFARASGLAINADKCVVVAFHDSASAPRITAAGFEVAGSTTLTRLLGGQVVTRDINAVVWALAMQQIRTRLHLATQRTTNEIQRVKLLRAFLLLKVLFVARHHWPRASQLARMQQLADSFVWTETFGEQRCRAWMSRNAAHAHPDARGLNIPDLKREVLAMSVGVLQRWSCPSHGITGVVGQILQEPIQARDTCLTVRCTEAATPSLQVTLAATGKQIQHALATIVRDDEELSNVRELLSAIGRGSSKDYTWVGRGLLLVNYDRVAAPLQELRDHQATRYGNFDVQALLKAKVVGDGILLNAAGKQVSVGDFPGVVRAGDRLYDVLNVQWHSSGALGFSPRRLEWPLAPREARSFRHLCDAIALHHQGILRHQGQPEDMVLRPASLDIWRLTPASPGYISQ